MSDLYKKLQEYHKGEMYPFHMPGHKRQWRKGDTIPYGLDITEITDFDNLHAPEKGGIIWQMYEEAKELYGTYATYPLVNGSTCGIMAAISGCCGLHDEIIVGRNCHKSVYRTCELLGLVTHYIYPDCQNKYEIFSNIDSDYLDEYLNLYPDSKAVLVVSPTYEGVILDICQISKVVHDHNMILIVDEAHGAHLPFCKPEASAINQGADIVIQSLHKTLPSLTQTAVLHVCKEALNRKSLKVSKIKEYVSLYQSTSPSYILMASIAECLNICKEWKIDKTFDKYYKRLEFEREKYKDLKNLHLLSRKDIAAFDYDIGKFVFSTENSSINGEQLFNKLRKNGIECEMTAKNYVIAMTSVCDSEEGYQKLQRAIFDIDESLNQKKDNNESINHNEYRKYNGNRRTEDNEMEKIGLYFQKTDWDYQAVMTLREAMEAERCQVDLMKLKYQLDNDYVKTSSLPFNQVYHEPVAAEYVMVYPPGIPIIAPGERYTKKIVHQIVSALEQNLNVLGVEDGKVTVVV